MADPSNVYSTGCGIYGQLGHGNNKNISKFTFITRLKDKFVEKIFAGGHHSWFLLDYDDPLKSTEEIPSSLEGQTEVSTSHRAKSFIEKKSLKK